MHKFEMMASPDVSFFQILVFGVVRGGGGGKRAKNGPKCQNDKKFYLTPYLRNCTSQLKATFCKYWTSVKIKFSMICVYKDIKLKNGTGAMTTAKN